MLDTLISKLKKRAEMEYQSTYTEGSLGESSSDIEIEHTETMIRENAVQKLSNSKKSDFPVVNTFGMDTVDVGEDDTVINLEWFENGIFNFILVVGLPGSGKGTIGRELSSKYNATHIELDVFDQCGNMSESEVRAAGEPFASYILHDSQGNWYWKNAKTLSVNEKIRGNHDFIEHVIAYCKVHRDEIFVIDGTPIYVCMEPEEIANYPLVVKGTSAKHSFSNKVNRDLGKKGDKLHSKVTKEHLAGLLQYYWGDESALNKFIDAFKDASKNTK